MSVNMRILRKIGVSLEFSYTLSKLENSVRKYYYPRRNCQYMFFDAVEEKRRRKFFFSNLIWNKTLIDSGNTRPNLLRVTKPEDR